MQIGLTEFSKGYVLIQFIAKNKHSIEFVLKLNAQGSFRQLNFLDGEGAMECELSDLTDSMNLNFTAAERVAMQQTLYSLLMVLETQYGGGRE
ncbi:hypothetical protein [Latilactobacillus curvatus]|uniref:hypothetical protein n=1 Tax=Latilactobacillus curvatus TaxID=28038 RepID=UPI0020A3A201|nr:hypothetical protein [Latilactobacillus curvatus]UTC12389.1 hypothetical protein A4W75_04630 [Latilactobacillus curvatus]